MLFDMEYPKIIPEGVGKFKIDDFTFKMGEVWSRFFGQNYFLGKCWRNLYIFFKYRIYAPETSYTISVFPEMSFENQNKWFKMVRNIQIVTSYYLCYLGCSEYLPMPSDRVPTKTDSKKSQNLKNRLLARIKPDHLWLLVTVAIEK